MTRPRGRPPAGSDGPSDGQLLDAALEAFAERGFDGTSVRELARRAGVSHNLLPQRFGPKERLWYAAVDRGFALLLDDLLRVLDDPPPTEVERLKETVVRFVRATPARPAILRVIHQEAASPGPRLDYIFTRYIDPVRRMSEATLRDLHAAGQVRTTSVPLVYFLMTHGAGGPAAFPALAERFGEPLDAEAAVDVLFGGIAT